MEQRRRNEDEQRRDEHQRRQQRVAGDAARLPPERAHRQRHRLALLQDVSVIDSISRSRTEAAPRCARA